MVKTYHFQDHPKNIPLPKPYNFNFINYQNHTTSTSYITKTIRSNFIHYQKDTISISYTTKNIQLQFSKPPKRYDFNFVDYQIHTT